jgi:hypothetical protein
LKGEVLGQFKVIIGEKAFNCLLLREVIEAAVVLTRQDDKREILELNIVLPDEGERKRASRP